MAKISHSETKDEDGKFRPGDVLVLKNGSKIIMFSDNTDDDSVFVGIDLNTGVVASDWDTRQWRKAKGPVTLEN